MIIKNGHIFTDQGRFMQADIKLEGDRIVEIAPAGTLEGDEVIDATGKYVTPGFVDIHIHGAAGSDFCDATTEDVVKISRYEGSQGVTTFMGTTMAFDEEILTGVFEAAKPRFHQDGEGAVLRGVNMEGPFFNKAKKGAQAEKYIVDPDFDMFQRLYEKSGKNIRLIDVAPELPGALYFIRKASKLCTVSIAHTCATYDEAKAASPTALPIPPTCSTPCPPSPTALPVLWALLPMTLPMWRSSATASICIPLWCAPSLPCSATTASA